MRSVLAVFTAVVLFAAGLFSPVAEAVVDAGTRTIPVKPESLRALNYNFTYERMKGDEAYPQVIAGTPASVTNLYTMGSSDFGMNVPQNPRHLLPEHSSDFDMYFSGRGGTQSLTLAIELAAVAPQLRTKKVAFIVSPQWFSRTGLSASELAVTFSEQRWNALVENPHVTDETKRGILERLSAIDPTICDRWVDCDEWGARGTSPGGVVAARNALSQITRPAAVRVEDLKETWEEARAIAQYTLPYTQADGVGPMAEFDWDAALEAADAEGAKASTNDLFIDDRVYSGVKDIIAGRKTVYATRYWAESPGYRDLELFLDVARDVGVEVMVINQPMHALWMDRLGFTSEQRDLHYQRVRDICADAGVRVEDLSVFEYEPYFFGDLMHLGRKGWLRVTRAAYDFARS